MSLIDRIAEQEQQLAALKKLNDLIEKWQKDAQQAGFKDLNDAVAVLVLEQVLKPVGTPAKPGRKPGRKAADKADKPAKASKVKRFKRTPELDEKIIKFLEDHTQKQAADEFGASVMTIGNIWRDHKKKK